MKNIMTFLPLALTLLLACQPSTDSTAEVTNVDTIVATDTVVAEPQPELTAEQIVIDRELTFDKYTLEDSYEYKEETRTIQWDQIREQLLRIEQLQASPHRWGVLQNYKNLNGEAPLTKVWSRDSYRLVFDSLGVERYQSVPLYAPSDTLKPELYGRDGTLIAMTDTLGSNFWQGRVECHLLACCCHRSGTATHYRAGASGTSALPRAEHQPRHDWTPQAPSR